MRSNFILTVEDSKKNLSTLSLYCCSRQAINAFNALAFALPMNKKGIVSLTLALETRDGFYTPVNKATFKGVKNA